MRKILSLALAAAAVSPAAFAITSQPTDSSSTSIAAPEGSSAVSMPVYDSSIQPFSHFGMSAGMGLGGINLQAATNVNKYMNLRAVGNVFKYNINNINTNGMTLNGNLNLASSGVSLDFYPFPNHGLRFSPGVLFYNQNSANANITVSGGTSFTLDNNTYYSSSSDPVTGTGKLGLNAQNPAFTITTGWGNLISRRGGHFSVPFEIGAAFVGTPALNLALTGGQVCTTSEGEPECQNVASDSQLQSALQAQIAKYQNDLNPLKVYPIFSIGIGYSFKIR
jgi:hypothetical protein